MPAPIRPPVSSSGSGRLARAANTTTHQATLAARLTGRDRWLIRMLHEHRVLTSHQITRAAFGTGRVARTRLLELYRWRVLDRFQPFTSPGTAPFHYVLDTAGATVLAAELGLDPRDLHYRHPAAIGIAHSLRLRHTLGVNQFFTDLIHHARRSDGQARVTAWWSETRCGRHYGDLARPDAYGRWTSHGREIEFFLEFDTGSEALRVVAAKLASYHRLAAHTRITTPVLFHFPTPAREASARRALHAALSGLDDPASVPTATSHADPTGTPADRAWLPLAPHGTQTERRTLTGLLHVWPHLRLDTPTTQAPPPMREPVTDMPPVDPMPPLPEAVT